MTILDTQKMLLPLAVAACLITLVATPASGAELRLRMDTNVIEDTIYLSDVFENVPLAEDGVLARAPAPGQSQLFRADDLLDASARAGHTWANDERVRRITVTRASRAVSAREIEELVERALENEGQYGRIGDRFDADLSNRSYVLHLPVDAAASVSIAELQFDAQSGYFEVTLDAPGLPGEAPLLRGRATAVLEVPVIVSQVPLNTEFTEADIGYIDLPASRINQGIVLNARDLLGMAPRRNVRLGQPVRRSDIGRPILAARGTRIRVIYQVPGMALTVMGEVMEDGSLGDTIRIRNTTTNQVFDAELTGPGSAQAVPLLSSPLSLALNSN